MAALLERADEWDALTAAVGAAGRSRGSVVLVSGEAGIGKTSLVRAFAEHVAGRARRFVGGCDDLLTARPLGPLRGIYRLLGGSYGYPQVLKMTTLVGRQVDRLEFERDREQTRVPLVGALKGLFGFAAPEGGVGGFGK